MKRFRIKRFLCNLLISIAAFLVFAAVAEIVLRTTHLFGAKVSWSKPDRIIGYRYLPGYPYWFNDENDHPVVGRFNEYGWRDDEWSTAKPRDRYRIAVLGDSYVEAFQVETESTFLALTELQMSKNGNFDVELMNFGRSGFTQSEELLVLKNDVTQFSPDMVILFFFPGNDISDVGKKTASNMQRPFYYLTDNGGLLLDTSFVEMFGYKIRYPFTWLRRRSALVNLVYERYKIRQMQERQSSGSKVSERISGSYALCTDHPDAEYLRNYRLNKALIRAIAEYCGERGMRFMLVTIHNPAYIPEVMSEFLSMDSSFYAMYFEEDMKKYADSLNVSYIGLQSIFTAHYKRTCVVFHWTHWNYEGHKLVAAVLTDKLRSVLAGNDSEKGVPK